MLPAAAQPMVFIKNKAVNEEPVQIGGKWYISVSALEKTLECKIGVDEKTGEVSIDGQKKNLTAIRKGDRYYLPLPDLAGALELRYKYNKETDTIDLYRSYSIVKKVPLSAQQQAAGQEAVPDSITWFYSYKEGENYAVNSNRKLLLFFSAEWCGWCKKEEEVTFQDPRVIKALSSMSCVKLDRDDPVNKEYANKYSVEGIPNVVILDTSGNVILSIVGYHPPDNFLDKLSGAGLTK